MRPLGGNSSKLNLSTTLSASGIWSTSDHFLLKKIGCWPNTIRPKTPNVEVLMIAGGGAGGVGIQGLINGSGGGAGGYVFCNNVTVNSGTQYSLVVGAGGTASGGNGSNSTGFSLTQACGGGGGTNTAYSNPGNAGGSGGGGSGDNGPGGAGLAGQGCNGGNGGTGGAGGGGGGATAAGGRGNEGTGCGGAGIQYTQFAVAAGCPAGYFSGGGAGTVGPVGIGGGGCWGCCSNVDYSGSASPTAGGPGVTNTGGGGGGGHSLSSRPGGAGGSGIILIRYPDCYNPALSTTGSPTLLCSNGYIYYKFTGSGSITF